MEGILSISVEDAMSPDHNEPDPKYKRNVFFSAVLSLLLLASIVATVHFLPIYESGEPLVSQEATADHIIAFASSKHRTEPPVVYTLPPPVKSKALVPIGGHGLEDSNGDLFADDADEGVPSHTLGKSNSTPPLPLPLLDEKDMLLELEERVEHSVHVTSTGDPRRAVGKKQAALEHKPHDQRAPINRSLELRTPATVFKKSTKPSTKSGFTARILVCFISGNTPTSMDALPPSGICQYVIYAFAGYAKGRLRFVYPKTFEKFLEHARGSLSVGGEGSCAWGVTLDAAEAMSGQTGVWGENRHQFALHVHELLAAHGISSFGLADVHTTAADFIDTANDYLDFYTNFHGLLHKLRVPSGLKPTLFFGMRVLGMFYSNRDAFRDRVKNVLQFVDIFIYQTHVSRITKTCVSVFPSNRYYPGMDDQDSFDDALRTLTPPIVYKDDFHLVLSLSLSLLRFTMKGPDIEEIRRPCKNMISLPFKEYCNTTGFGEDAEDELQIGVYRFNERKAVVDTFETADVIEFKMNDVMREYQLNGLDVGFAAFYLEHEDYRGECGNSFARLRMMSKCLRNFV
ncbi:uncharacterized protein LOC144094664 isoform X2 [Amblyomma americanum]